MANDSVSVKQSGIHNKGVFAKKDILKGEKVIEYVGEKITKAESDRRFEATLHEHKNDPNAKGSVYIFTLNKRYDIDGQVSYNDAKFINHSCEPNCEVEIIRGHIWIMSTRDIKKGEELSYNYGYDIDDFEDHPCYCGSERCIGYILDEDYWDRVKKKYPDRFAHKKNSAKA